MKISFQTILKNLITEKMSPDQVASQFKDQAQDFVVRILTGKVEPGDPELEAFLRVCLDVYTYSMGGEVLIPDSIYDKCMQVYKSDGKETIVFADSLGTQWNFIKHKIPGVVGTIDKVYTYKELKSYLERFRGVKRYTISPKYDGISADIEVKDGKIVSAATRYNGIDGQDITSLVKQARNAGYFMDDDKKNGHYKVELCVSTEDFQELTKLKGYKNRRSATSGIVSTPSNLRYAGFVTIVPLAFYDDKRKQLYYIAPCQKEINFYSPADLMDDVETLLDQVRTKDFPFRVDGVVINPDRELLGPPNELDLMDTSIAYKVNTAEGKTRIRYGYMSVGRSGKAVPMIKVEPVEVNETIVEDVSLGSYDKFLSMDLRENEEVVIYSAGDVIPQMKLPPIRTNFENAEDLKMDRHCPYCGEKFTRINTEYYCKNPKCIRVITGRIANFLDKMGVQGFSDKTVELIHEATHVSTITDFLNLSEEALKNIEGFGEISASGLVNMIQTIRRTPISISQFFGSLGIDGISEKKCRKIFEMVSLRELLNPKTKDSLKDIYWELQNADGIGAKTAAVFIQFIADNLDELQKLVKMFNLERDIKYRGNIAFTGFRPNQEIRDRIHALGYEINESGVTSETKALVSASLEKQSTKSKAAVRMGIPIYPATSLEELFYSLSHQTEEDD